MPRLRVICSFVSIITVLVVGFGVGTAQAAIVPELTGGFSQPGGVNGGVSGCFNTLSDPGGLLFFGAFGEMNGVHGNLIDFSISTSQNPPVGVVGQGGSCAFTYSGTTDGPITGTFKNLTFKGNVTGGTEAGNSEFFCGETGSGRVGCIKSASGSFTAPFTGNWSNGWHSTGTVGGSWTFGFPPIGIGSLSITTETPEPSTFMMLGAGLLPVIGVIRRRYLNR